MICVDIYRDCIYSHYIIGSTGLMEATVCQYMYIEVDVYVYISGRSIDIGIDAVVNYIYMLSIYIDIVCLAII